MCPVRLCASKEPSYRRRQPETTLLFQLVQHNWPTFMAELDVTLGCLPAFIGDEFEAYLRCGILAHGFVNVRCDDCKETRPVACYLVDHVFAEVPVRQWVLTAPHALRFAMARYPALTNRVLRIHARAVSTWMKRRARKLRCTGKLKTGGVTVLQRFGSGLALNDHFHSVMIDGIYRVDVPGTPEFVPIPVSNRFQHTRFMESYCAGCRGDSCANACRLAT